MPSLWARPPAAHEATRRPKQSWHSSRQPHDHSHRDRCEKRGVPEPFGDIGKDPVKAMLSCPSTDFTRQSSREMPPVVGLGCGRSWGAGGL